MSKSYPRISGTRRHPKNTQAKCKCGQIGRFKVTIECSWFRGEDDVMWACNDHVSDVEFLYYNEQR